MTVRLIIRLCSLTAAKHADKFDAYVDGHYIVTSREPLLDGARELLRRGYDPDTLVTTRHDGKAFYSFEPAPLGRLAGLTIEESEESGPTGQDERRPAEPCHHQGSRGQSVALFGSGRES